MSTIKPWQERESQYETAEFSTIERMNAEIVELRAELAKRNDSTEPSAIPDVLFDGPAVFDEITRMLGKGHRISPVAMATTMDAIVNLMRKAGAGALPDELQSRYAAYVKQCEAGKILPCSFDSFQAEQDRVAKDAARYRWLRDRPSGTRHGDMLIIITETNPTQGAWSQRTVRGADMDSAIDAARGWRANA
jgi:hypothetical protein